jgi:hypothetical protein
MAFGSKKTRATEPSPELQPEQSTQMSAWERLTTLLNEQSDLEAIIAGHREERAQLMRDSDAPAFDAITAIAAQTEQAKLRLEWIAHQLPGLQAEVERQQAAAWEAAWQVERPALAEAQAELVTAIKQFYAALRRAHELHGAAVRFGERLREFVPPPPPIQFNNWSLGQYLAIIEQREQAQEATAPAITFEFESVDVLPARRFRPRKVSYEAIEAISPLLPHRRVRVTEGPLRMTGFNNIGRSRLMAGEEIWLPARAAFAVTESGAGIYLDEPTTTPAA